MGHPERQAGDGSPWLVSGELGGELYDARRTTQYANAEHRTQDAGTQERILKLRKRTTRGE